MLNKEYLFEPAGVPPYLPRGQANDRQGWNPPLQSQLSEKSKRDQIWEQKKQQRLYQPHENLYPYENPSFSINQSSFDQPINYSNIENFPDYSYDLPKLGIKDHAKLNPNLSPEYINPVDVSKKIENDKKKYYAEELRRQIEEKNKLKINQRSGRALEKNENQEFFAQGRFASADRKGESDGKMMEREKKLQYARELEAQIQMKRMESGRRHGNEESVFAANGEFRRNAYDRDQELYSRGKNRNISENRVTNLPEYQRDAYNSQTEPEKIPIRREIEISVQKINNQSEFDKKQWYKQELEKQIEDQKRRKEEEKRKKQSEDEIIERNIFCERSEKKKEDKKIIPKPHLKNPYDEPNLPNNIIQRAEKIPDANLYENPGRKLLDEGISDTSFDQRKPNNTEPPVQFNPYRPANEILTPFGQEKSLRNLILPKSPIPPQEPRNQLIDNYLREILEVRKERDAAREQCLEMREMMLREKEKNLEQMLNLMKNKSNESLNNHFDKGYAEKPVLNQNPGFFDNNEINKNPLPRNPSGYANAAYEQVQKELYMPTEVNSAQFEGVNKKYPVQTNYEKVDLFEKSLASKSKFVDPKWSDPTFEPQHRQERLRKKWDNRESSDPTNFEQPSLLAKYRMDQEYGHLEEISEDNESLPGKATQVKFLETMQKTEEDDFFKKFQEKYVNKGFSSESNEKIQGLEAEKNEIDLNFSEKPEIEMGSKKSSVKGLRAFSRLQEARKHSQNVEIQPKSTEFEEFSDYNSEHFNN